MAKKIRKKKMSRGDKIVLAIFLSVVVGVFTGLWHYDSEGTKALMWVLGFLYILSALLSPIVYGFLEADKNQCYRDNDN